MNEMRALGPVEGPIVNVGYERERKKEGERREEQRREGQTRCGSARLVSVVVRPARRRGGSDSMQQRGRQNIRTYL